MTDDDTICVDVAGLMAMGSTEVPDNLDLMFPDEIAEVLPDAEAMIDSEWDLLAPVEVDLDDVFHTQDFVNPTQVAHYAHAGWDDPPHLIGFDGRYWVVEGNHRVTAARRRGDRTVTARVFQIGG